MIIPVTGETITVFCLCIIVAFMFGLVGGISIEYHNYKKEMGQQQADEAKRLQELAKIVEYACDDVRQEQQ